MITEDLIFYFVRRVYLTFGKEWQEVIKNTRIVVSKDMYLSNVDGKPEALGAYHNKVRVIEYFLPSLRNYFAAEKDLYLGLKKIESVVEHEMLHAIGFNHNQIDEYRKKKEELELKHSMASPSHKHKKN